MNARASWHDQCVLDLVADLLRIGGAELIGRRHERRRVEQKRSAMDLVTDADRASEAQILARLATVAPDDGYLSEEAGFSPGRSGRTWVIDPLDGTTNYTAGLSDFGVIIGAVEHDTVTAGGMYLPALDLLYLAAPGRGATRNGEPITASTTARVTEAVIDHSLANLPGIVDEQRRTLDLLIAHARGVRCNHSLRYLGCVAEGTLDGFVYHSLGLWDLVGSSVILLEAGAIVRDLAGAPLDLVPTPESPSRVYTAIGGNPTLVAELVRLLGEPGR